MQFRMNAAHCNTVIITSSDSKISDLQEKYNREVEERKRLEAEIKVMHVKVSKIHIFVCKKSLVASNYINLLNSKNASLFIFL